MAWFRGRSTDGGLRARLEQTNVVEQTDSWAEGGPPVTRRRGDAPTTSGLGGWTDGHVTGVGVFAEPSSLAADELVLKMGRVALPCDAAVRHDWAGGRIDLMICGGAHQVRVALAGSGAELVETVVSRRALAASEVRPDEAGPFAASASSELQFPRDLERTRRGETWRFASSIATLDSVAFERAVRDMHSDLDDAARAVAVTYMAPPGLDRVAPWAGTIGAVACMPTPRGVAWRAWTVLPATGEVVVTTSELVRDA